MKTIKISGNPKTAVVVTTNPDNSHEYVIVSVGDFVRLNYLGESYDGIVRDMDNDAILLGWFNVHNDRVLDAFSWDEVDIIVY